MVSAQLIISSIEARGFEMVHLCADRAVTKNAAQSPETPAGYVNVVPLDSDVHLVLQALNSPSAHSISKLAEFFDIGSAHWEAVVRSEEVRALINYTPASDTCLSSIQPIISNTLWHIDTA